MNIIIQKKKGQNKTHFVDDASIFFWILMFVT